MLTAKNAKFGRTCLSAQRRQESVVRKRLILTALAAALVTSSTWSVAAESPQSGKPGMSMHGNGAAPTNRKMGGSGGMEGMGGMDGMMGMMDMMGTCNRMTQGGMTGSIMPQLPPGNEKLQLQMQAEMMQKMGETLGKYAAQIKDDKR